VKYGLAENNRMIDNRDYGISIGHNDTDNVMRGNEITGSGKVGLLFRDDGRGLDFWANRNTFENNKIIDSGDDNGVAIDIQGQTKDLKIANNELRETRRPMNRTAIRIGPAAQRIELADNRIEGFAQTIVRQQ
jgi:parallel beta-helix repeat protein